MSDVYPLAKLFAKAAEKAMVNLLDENRGVLNVTLKARQDNAGNVRCFVTGKVTAVSHVTLDEVCDTKEVW